MDIHALSYFKKAADLQHITRAAEELHVAQPSLSRTITQLEGELGVRLFERTGKNIYLNKYGEIVLRRTNRILKELEYMEREVNDALEGAPLTVSLSMYAVSKLLPDLIMSFKQAYPTIRLQIRQGGTTKNPLEESDLSIFSSTQPSSGKNSLTLLEEEILLAVPKWHPLSPERSVHLQQAADSEFICLQKGKNLRSIMDTYCALADFEPKIVLETDSPETLRGLIAAGMGVSFIPSITWPGSESPSIVLIPISAPNCRRFINLSWRADGYMPPAAILLRGFIQDYFKKLK